MYKLIYLIIPFFLFACSNETTSKNEETITYTKNDSIEGPISVAKKVKEVTDKKDYDALIPLFSKERQLWIKTLKENQVEFEQWAAAWSLSDQQLETYIQMIKSGKAKFKFEDGAWKIDEI